MQGGPTQWLSYPKDLIVWIDREVIVLPAEMQPAKHNTRAATALKPQFSSKSSNIQTNFKIYS